MFNEIRIKNIATLITMGRLERQGPKMTFEQTTLRVIFLLNFLEKESFDHLNQAKLRYKESEISFQSFRVFGSITWYGIWDIVSLFCTYFLLRIKEV